MGGGEMSMGGGFFCIFGFWMFVFIFRRIDKGVIIEGLW